MNLVPRKAFLVTGSGAHREKLVSFELALRKGGMERYNLVYVSSIFPPSCSLIPKEEGLSFFQDGQIVFCVMAKAESNIPNTLVSSAIGLAIPKSQNHYGYIAEYSSLTESKIEVGERAKNLAKTMLSTSLGLNSDFHQDSEATQGHFEINHTVESQLNMDGLWTTTIASLVFVL